MLNECYRKMHKLSFRTEVIADTLLYEKSIPMFTNNSKDDTENKVGNKELNGVIESAIKRIPIG